MPPAVCHSFNEQTSVMDKLTYFIAGVRMAKFPFQNKAFLAFKHFKSTSKALNVSIIAMSRDVS